MKCLITGSAGFAAAHAVEHYLKTTNWDILGVDSLEHKGDMRRVAPFLCDRYHFIKMDLTKEVPAYKPDVIINFASESHVDRSIESPVPFVRNNVELMISMLEYARLVKPKMFIQVSTDEVYGATDGIYTHKEWSTSLPSNPYSASKMMQEGLAISYWRTYGVPVVITNSMNMFGERQDKEKYIPMVISRVLNGETVQVHGEPDNIGTRFYLHARNHADALKFIINNAKALPFGKYGTGVRKTNRPNRFNIVGDVQVDNLTMAQTIADVIGKPLKYELVNFHHTRPGHDPHYGLDGSKLNQLGWKPPVKFAPSLKKNINWTLTKGKEWL